MTYAKSEIIQAILTGFKAQSPRNLPENLANAAYGIAYADASLPELLSCLGNAYFSASTPGNQKNHVLIFIEHLIHSDIHRNLVLNQTYFQTLLSTMLTPQEKALNPYLEKIGQLLDSKKNIDAIEQKSLATGKQKLFEYDFQKRMITLFTSPYLPDLHQSKVKTTLTDLAEVFKLKMSHYFMQIQINVLFDKPFDKKPPANPLDNACSKLTELIRYHALKRREKINVARNIYLFYFYLYKHLIQKKAFASASALYDGLTSKPVLEIPGLSEELSHVLAMEKNKVTQQEHFDIGFKPNQENLYPHLEKAAESWDVPYMDYYYAKMKWLWKNTDGLALILQGGQIRRELTQCQIRTAKRLMEAKPFHSFNAEKWINQELGKIDFAPL